MMHLYLVLKDGKPWHGERKYHESRLRVYSSYNRARAAIRSAARADEWSRFDIVKFTRFDIVKFMEEEYVEIARARVGENIEGGS